MGPLAISCLAMRSYHQACLAARPFGPPLSALWLTIQMAFNFVISVVPFCIADARAVHGWQPSWGHHRPLGRGMASCMGPKRGFGPWASSRRGVIRPSGLRAASGANPHARSQNGGHGGALRVPLPLRGWLLLRLRSAQMPRVGCRALYASLAADAPAASMLAAGST